MAFILSLFSDAEMSGLANAAATPASVDVRPTASAVPNECAAERPVGSGLIDEWVKGFHSNPNEEQERLGTVKVWGVNPCIHCKYRGLCDTDYCAMLIGPIDMDHKPTRRGWINYGIY